MSTCCFAHAGSGGLPFRFELRYNRTSEDEESCVINGISDLSKTIDDLEPLTRYTVRIRAENAGGASEFSENVTFSTYGECEVHYYSRKIQH